MNTQLILPLLLLPYWVTVAQSTDVEFTTNTTEAQARAVQEDKLYFVHFTATWCVPCQWMEENTFTNDTLTAFVRDYYLAVKMDFDDPNAAHYKRLYQVTSLPSLLIFNAKGELIDRYKTSLSKDELLQILAKNFPKTSRSRKTESNGTPALKVTHRSDGKIYRPALVPDDSKVAKPKPNTDVHVNAAPKTPAVPQSIKDKPLIAKFAIQIGVFSDRSNAERTRARMEQRFGQPVQMLKTQQNDKFLYKIMLGEFTNKADADTYLERLKAQEVPGYVKAIAE